MGENLFLCDFESSPATIGLWCGPPFRAATTKGFGRKLKAVE